MLNSKSNFNNAGSDTSGEFYKSAVRSAWVAGVFSLVVSAFLFVNAYHLKVTDIENEDNLVAMKQKLPKQGTDEKLLEQIRQQDLQNRQDRFTRLNSARMGSWLLLTGLVVFFASLKWAFELRKKLPQPHQQPDKQQLQNRQLILARRAVAACLILFCFVSAVLAFKGEIKFSADKVTAAAPYPSMEEVYKNWPSFRGPEGAGISAYTNIPDKWDGKTGDGIIWKTPVPLEGNNSPVVWGNRIFLTGSDAEKFVHQVYCFDADSGKLLWTGDVPNAVNADGEPLEVMEDTGLAAPTAVTDGRRVYAIFATGNIAAFDYEGKSVWLRKLGIPDSVYGYSASLAMYQDKVIVQFDQATSDDGLSKLIALDSFTGQTAWETKRPVGNSWSSPIVAKAGDSYRLITAADPWAIAYDPATGAEIWRAECIMGDVASTPIYSKGLAFAIEPYSRLVAIRTGGTGNVTDTHIAWFAEDDIPDICSPISTGEVVYILTSDGYLTCYQLKDGKKLYDHDMEKNFNASPSLVGDKLYLLSLKGVMFIIQAGLEYKEITTCELGEKCFASPAFADGRIYIRGLENLYCIGTKK